MLKNFYAFLTLAVFAALCIGEVHAQQVSDYTFSAKDTTFTFQRVDSVLSETLPDDDVVYSNIPLGFSFPFKGTNYSIAKMASNGVIGFNPSNALGGLFATGNGSAFTSSNTEIIAIVNADMTASSQAPSEIGIKRGTIGGQRYFLLNYRRLRRYETGGGGAEGFPGDSVNVQCWLWQSGKINLIYGPSAIDPSGDRTAHIGLKGADATDLLAVTGSWAAPTTSNVVSTMNLSSTDTWRNAGRMFTFTPAASVSNDIALRNIVLPGLNSPLCGGSATQTIEATLVNLGASPVSSTSVGYQINGGAVVRKTVTFPQPLQRFASATVSFTAPQTADLSTPGTYTFKVFGEFTSDLNRVNDTASLTRSLGADIILPSGRQFNTYSSLTGTVDGWTLRQGVNGVDPYTGSSLSNFLDGTNSVAANFMSTFTTTTNVWMVRHGLRNGDATPKAVGLKVAVGNTVFGGGVNAISDIPTDDSLNVLYSTNCGTSWTKLRTFKASDLAAGTISNSYTSFVLPLSVIPANTNFSIAIQITSGGTSATNSYSWLVDEVRFPSGTDAGAEAIITGSGGLTFDGCALSAQEPVGVRVRNFGVSTATSVGVSYTLNGGTAVTNTFPVNLGAGEDTVLFFRGAQGANMSALGTYVLRTRVTLAGDNVASNDTLSRRIVLGGSLDTIPARAIYQTIDQLTTEGFARFAGSGSAFRNVSNNVFIGGFPPIWDATTTATISTTTGANTVDWFLRPEYALTSSQVSLRFSLLVSNQNSGADTISNIGDDTLSVVASNDCGATFRTLRSFSQADLAAGVIDNIMRTFSVPIPFNSGSLVIGWRFNSNRTAAPRPYRWQMDSIRFRSGVDIQLQSVSGIPAVASSCGSGNPVKFVYQNVGTVAVDSVILGYQVGSGTPVTSVVIRRLPVGGKDSATMAPVVYPGSGTWPVVAGAGARGDVATGNNTATFSTIYRGSTALPASQYGNLNTLISAGFSSGSGPGGANPTPSFVASTSYTNFNPTAAATVSASTSGYEEIWLTSPLYRGQNAASVNLRFRVAVTSGSTGTNFGAAIGTDDSLAIYVRRNCGAWELAQVYTGADYASGNISNSLDPQRVVQLSQVAQTDSFQVAFKVSNGGTPPTQTYRWHINFIYITDLVSTRASLQQLGLSLYPNPAQHVAYLSGVKGSATVTLADMQGRVVRTYPVSAAMSKLDLQGLAKGTYILRAQTREGAGVQRFVVE